MKEKKERVTTRVKDRIQRQQRNPYHCDIKLFVSGNVLNGVVRPAPTVFFICDNATFYIWSQRSFTTRISLLRRCVSLQARRVICVDCEEEHATSVTLCLTQSPIILIVHCSTLFDSVEVGYWKSPEDRTTTLVLCIHLIVMTVILLPNMKLPFILKLWTLLLAMSHAAPNKTKKSPSVAVVGAGFAGLAAVGRLRELGFEEVILFEGSDHFGGRVHSIPFGTGRLQQGAQYINGKDNEIYRIAEKLNLIVGEEPDDTWYANGDIYMGECNTNKALVEEWYKFTDPLEDKYREMGENPSNYALGMGDVYAKDYKLFLSRHNRSEVNVFDALNRFYVSFWEGEMGAMQDYALANFALWDDGEGEAKTYTMNEGEMGAMQDYALANFALWDDGEGEAKTYTMNEVGFYGIAKYLKSFVPDEMVKYGHFVKNIDYRGPKVQITVQQGPKTFRYPKQFDHVIVTSSLGHLKRYARTLFKPQLPSQKLEAIDAIGYVLLASCSTSTRFPNLNGTSGTSSLMQYVNTISELEWDERVLVLWVAAHGTEALDGVKDDHLGKMITEHLRFSMNDHNVPAPKQLIREHWVSNKLFLGAYSYISSKSANLPGGGYPAMMEPVASKVFFAGEATHPSMYQTTIGAYESGRREAERIAKLVGL
uniref:Amino_oxidase domain-containing protein n=1 Tax=Steinernema glaseri TaxID=37863 RepID=A0A1I8AQ76_9BILA